VVHVQHPARHAVGRDVGREAGKLLERTGLVADEREVDAADEVRRDGRHHVAPVERVAARRALQLLVREVAASVTPPSASTTGAKTPLSGPISV